QRHAALLVTNRSYDISAWKESTDHQRAQCTAPLDDTRALPAFGRDRKILHGDLENLRLASQQTRQQTLIGLFVRQRHANPQRIVSANRTSARQRVGYVLSVEGQTREAEEMAPGGADRAK